MADCIYRLAKSLGYWVDMDNGHIYSPKGRKLAVSMAQRGGAVFGINVSEGKRRSLYLRRFIAFLVHGDIVFDKEMRSWNKNGNQLDCRPSNIAIGTHKSMMRAASKLGKMKNVGGQVSNVLTDADVAAIRLNLFSCWKNGRIRRGEAKKVAIKYGVSVTTIGRIAHFATHKVASGLPPLPKGRSSAYD